MPERRFSGWDLEAWRILLKEIWNCETFEVVDTKVYFLLSLFDADKDHHKRTLALPSLHPRHYNKLNSTLSFDLFKTGVCFDWKKAERETTL